MARAQSAASSANPAQAAIAGRKPVGDARRGAEVPVGREYGTGEAMAKTAPKRCIM